MVVLRRSVKPVPRRQLVAGLRMSESDAVCEFTHDSTRPRSRLCVRGHNIPLGSYRWLLPLTVCDRRNTISRQVHYDIHLTSAASFENTHLPKGGQMDASQFRPYVAVRGMIFPEPVETSLNGLIRRC